MNLHYVYIILCTRPGSENGRPGLFYKIGHCNNLNRRFAEIQQGCPFELELFFWVRFKDRDCARYAEEQMHLKYREKRIRKEWFFFANHSYRRQSLVKVKKFLARCNNAVEASEPLLL